MHLEAGVLFEDRAILFRDPGRKTGLVLVVPRKTIVAAVMSKGRFASLKQPCAF